MRKGVKLNLVYQGKTIPPKEVLINAFLKYSGFIF
jgi:hypothetical protein